MDVLNQLIAKGISTPERLRTFTLRRYHTPQIESWLAGGRASWKSLQTAAEALRHKDGIDAEAGDFLHISIPFLRKIKERRTIKEAWEHPRECGFCFRISGHRKNCEEHDCQLDQAGYRRGARISPLFHKIWLEEKSERKKIPAIPFQSNDLSSWMNQFAPNVHYPANLNLRQLLWNLDAGSSERNDISEYRNLEHCRMTGLERRLTQPKTFFQPSTDEARAFVLRADAWERAKMQLRKGKRGGKRAGAGRPKI